MVSRNYSEEIGLNTGQRIVPLPYVIAIIAAILAVGWLAFSTVRPKGHEAAKTFGVMPATTQTVALKN
jgi:hypothetical protein